MPRARPALERFWEKVLKIEGADTCWPWMGRSLTFYDGEKRWLAHRYSFVLHAGPIPDKLMVRRTCGDQFCMRPTHMILQKNCHQGSQHPLARLDESKVIRIMQDLREGMSVTAASEKYGVSNITVYQVARGKTWRHVHRQPILKERKPQPEKKPPRKKKLTDDQVREIRRRRGEGALVVSLAGEFEVNPSAISAICHHRMYKDVE